MSSHVLTVISTNVISCPYLSLGPSKLPSVFILYIAFLTLIFDKSDEQDKKREIILALERLFPYIELCKKFVLISIFEIQYPSH